MDTHNNTFKNSEPYVSTSEQYFGQEPKHIPLSHKEEISDSLRLYAKGLLLFSVLTFLGALFSLFQFHLAGIVAPSGGLVPDFAFSFKMGPSEIFLSPLFFLALSFFVIALWDGIAATAISFGRLHLGKEILILTSWGPLIVFMFSVLYMTQHYSWPDITAYCVLILALILPKFFILQSLLPQKDTTTKGSTNLTDKKSDF